MSRPYAKGKKPYVSQPRPPLFEGINAKLRGIAGQVLKLPRFARFIIVSLCALTITFAIFPIVDQIYLNYFYTEATRILPSFVSVGVGIITYMLGWRLIVGTIGEEPNPGVAVFWYIVTGLLAAGIVIALLLQGYSMISDSTL